MNSSAEKEGFAKIKSRHDAIGEKNWNKKRPGDCHQWKHDMPMLRLALANCCRTLRKRRELRKHQKTS